MCRQGVHFTLGGFGGTRATSSKRPKEDCSSSRSGGTKGLEREQGVNQGEGRKDSRRAQPESAGCSACQARGWAGLGMTRPGHCQHCSPCPVRAVTPPTAEPTREGAPAAKQQGVQGISPGPYFHPLALDLDLGLGPACSVFSHNKVSSGLFVSPQLPTPPPNALSTWASALAGPEGQSGQDRPHRRGLAAPPLGLTSASQSPTSLAGVPTR